MHKRTESGEKYWWDVLMIKTRFVFAVSLVAMLAVGSAWADAPAAGGSLGNPHDVYQTQLPTDAKGIAGVSYVNKAVNVAGASAQAAEAHAAAAGQHALDAAASATEAKTSAQSANDALANKADKSDLNNYATTTAVNAKEATANKLTSTATTTVSESNKDTLYPSVGKVQSMINALDVTDSAQAGKYVSAVSETDGKITVTRASLPTIPTVNDATLTIQKNGTNVATFTANSGTAATANITVPTTVAELSDSEDYATVEQVNVQLSSISTENGKLRSAVEQLQGDLESKQTESTAEYQMGNASGGWTTMTAAQQNALNSGVTSATKVTHTANTAAGTTTRPVYVTSGGVATAVTGVSIPYGAESNPTSWVTIWVE